MFLTNFSALWDRKFLARKCDTTLLTIVFFPYQNLSEAQVSPPTNVFGNVRQKKLENTVMPLLLCMKTFITSFSKYRSVPLRFILLLGDKKLPTEKGDDPHLIHKFFTNRTFRNHKGSPYESYPLTAPFFLCMKFFIFRFYRNTERFPYELFQQCETKKTQTEKRETFPHSHILILPTRAFLEHKGPPCGSFGTVRQKNPTKLWCPPPRLCMKRFITMFFSKDRRVPPTNIFSTVRQNFFDPRNVIPPFLSINFFHIRTILNHKAPPYETFG